MCTSAKRALLLFILSGVLCGSSHALAVGEGARFGIRGLNRTKGLQEAIQVAKGSGVSWTRIAVFWDEVEPQKGKFEWEKTDTIVSELLGHGINVMVTVRSYSGWASAKSKIVVPRYKKWLRHKRSAMPEPQNIEHYKEFVQNLVERYDGDNDFGGLPPSSRIRNAIKGSAIKYWQIENEPGSCHIDRGSNFWNGSAEELAELTMLASDSIRAADPDAKIVLCGFGVKGTTRCIEEYPDRLLHILRKNRCSFEVFDVHNYRNVETIYEQVANVKRLLQRHAFGGVSIWMTETDFSWRSLDLGISQKRYNECRAISMIKRHVVAFSLGVERVFQWKLSDSKGARWPPRQKSELSKFRGITDTDLNPKPIFSTYQLMISKLDGFSKVEKMGGGARKLFRFLVKGHPIFVAWNDGGASTLSLDVGKAKITDPFGRVRIDAGNRLRITHVPVFIEAMDAKSPAKK